MAGIGHVFLVPQRGVLNKGTSRIVQPLHSGFCTPGTSRVVQGPRRFWCDVMRNSWGGVLCVAYKKILHLTGAGRCDRVMPFYSVPQQG
jgi:hypothetical protein